MERRELSTKTAIRETTCGYVGETWVQQITATDSDARSPASESVFRASQDVFLKKEYFPFYYHVEAKKTE